MEEENLTNMETVFSSCLYSVGQSHPYPSTGKCLRCKIPDVGFLACSDVRVCDKVMDVQLRASPSAGMSEWWDTRGDGAAGVDVAVCTAGAYRGPLLAPFLSRIFPSTPFLSGISAIVGCSSSPPKVTL